ncbi:DNA-directed RNA polymerase subunit beta', partial [Patescibacteria group bacterium]|nr:DNA-directed RNA polymerase subunit beta' [Patescibacteria group bacterium]
KQGRFRQNLLGKRVDYSGRSVIVVGPALRLHQCGLPKRMALELFKPFVIQKILDAELAYNVRGAARLIENETDDVWALLEEVVKDKVVLLNRAPTLHRLGIQGFYPVLVEGEAIHLHPLVCEAFNADFDGDQMAVHVPLSKEAQEEARNLMMASKNFLKPATGNPIVGPRQEMVLGCYYLTGTESASKDSGSVKGRKRIYSSSDEAVLAYETGVIGLRELVRVEELETTVGRIIFNEAFPKDHEFVNERMDSKKLGILLAEIIKIYSAEEVEEFLDRIKRIGFEYATKSGTTWGMDDLVVPKEKKKLVSEAEQEIEAIDKHWRRGLLSSEERSAKVIEIWQRVKSQIEKLVPKALPFEGSVYSIINSGARGSWSQPVQMSGMKGLVINPSGRIIELPVKNSFKEGFGVLEYFISTHGARKGTADTALRTSTAGYLTRRLIDVAHDVLVSELDCKDDKGITVLKKDATDLGQSLGFKIFGRTAGATIGKHVKKGETIDWAMADEIDKDEKIKEINIRSPLSCKTIRGVCQSCYGWDLGSSKNAELGSTVGIIAAQSIGEPGTQLTMRTFHTGGVAGGGDITQGLPRVEEIFEGRVPSGKSQVSEVDGVVQEISEELVSIKPTDKKAAKELYEYDIPAKRAVWVSKGDTVVKGQQLCEGSVDLAELFRVSGKATTQKYIIQEVQRIYTS